MVAQMLGSMGMPSSGDVVHERYRLVEQLGRGGMGTVWRAHHIELDVDVAIKLLSQDVDPSGLRRFKREARAAAKLRSPHIVHATDFGLSEGQPFLAMELLEGEDLAARMEAGRLDDETSVSIVEEVARALEVAHEAGIIHRDLKPANIFMAKVGDEELAKVLDFGVAKDTNVEGDVGSTTDGGMLGSPAYMSPEQVWMEPLTPKSDLWSLGVVTFELVTGENPFADSSLAKVFDHIVRDDLPRASDFRDDLSPQVDAFFERALSRDPAERYDSARELAEAFRAAMFRGNVDALADTTRVDAELQPRRPTATASRTWPWLLLIGAVVGVVLWTLGGSETPSPAARPRAVEPQPTLSQAPSTAPPAASTPTPTPAATPSSTATTKPTTTPQPTPPPTGAAPKPTATPRFDPFTGIPIKE